MKKNKIILGLVAILIIMSLLSGCGGGSETKPQTSQTTPTTTTPTTPTPTPAPTPAPDKTTDNTLSDMLGKAAGIASVKYDMQMTMPGMPTMTSKVWIKKNKTRTEIPDQGMVMLLDIDAKTMYMYMPAQNTAMKMPFDLNQAPQTDQANIDAVMNCNPQTVGTEAIDGKTCSVIQYNLMGTNIKSWIWKDKGIALRTETTSSMGKSIIELKNVDFSDIPDSVFELPSGVNITSGL